MAKREFLQLAHVYDPCRHHVGGWFASEKLDGMRAFWDGGITRGMLAESVPFANVEKDGRYISKPMATGLWSRYGKTIQAPDWWLDGLPVGMPLDGELYMGRGKFQQITSIVKQMVPDARWRGIVLKVFDCPPYRVVFGNGEITNPNYTKKFVDIYYQLEGARQTTNQPPGCDFRTVYNWLQDTRNASRTKDCSWDVLRQEELPYYTHNAQARIEELVEDIVNNGGEGLILRHPTSFWVPQRTHTCLKVKRCQDDEAVVVGYVWGRETNKGSKLLGKMGALVVTWHGKNFELSGFTDEERRMQKRPDMVRVICDETRLFEAACREGIKCPGEAVGIEFHNPQFPVGSVVTFRYRELTDAGIPKEARYWRKA